MSYEDGETVFIAAFVYLMDCRAETVFLAVDLYFRVLSAELNFALFAFAHSILLSDQRTGRLDFSIIPTASAQIRYALLLYLTTMEYQVPQFIEVEDKIIGPLTLKQFIYTAGAAGITVVCFAYLPFVFAVLAALPVIGLAGALAFYKVNGKPFIEVLEAGFSYYTGGKLFLWKHEQPTAREQSAATQAAAAADAAAKIPRGSPKLTRGKLSELAWSLDVKAADNARKS